MLGESDPARHPAVMEDIGVVLSEAVFPEEMTAGEMDKMFGYLFKNWDSQLYQSYLERLDLPVDRVFKKFSRGMKMKLSIAVALGHGSRLLILDEPTSGLDPMVRDEILDIFFEYTRDEEHSILISSHIVGDLEKLCDYIAFLHKGKLLFCEEKDRLLEQYGVYRGSEEQEMSMLGLLWKDY